MMPSYEFENNKLREENNALRAERNAAQQRAEQAERERNEARAVVDRAIEILGSPVPDGVSTKDQMANEHLNVNALLTDFRQGYAPQPAPTVKAEEPVTEPVRQHKFVEVPGHVHWLFVNWPKFENDGEILEACLRNYNQWIDDGYTSLKHIPMGDGKLLIEFRKPEVSA